MTKFALYNYILVKITWLNHYVTKYKYILLMIWSAGLCNNSYSQIIFDRNAVLDKIKAYADYASRILVDESGRSRCNYDIFNCEWLPYEVPWHTGQLINALVEAYKVTRNMEYLHRATFCANWWVTLEIKNHPLLNGMLRGIHGGDMDKHLIVFATISDGTPGLYNLSRVLNDSRYAEVATKAARWMLNNMYDPSKGGCYDNVDEITGKVIRNTADFDGNIYYTYRPNTEGYLFKDAYGFSGDSCFRKAYLVLCDSLISSQNTNGLWMQFKPNDLATGYFHPRYNLWTAESLIEAYEMTGDAKYLEAAAKTARLYSRYQDQSGAMFYKANLNGGVDRSTICSSEAAFAGLIWMRLSSYGHHEFQINYERTLHWLVKASFNINHHDPNLQGAAIEIKTSLKNGKTQIINRDLGTIFAIRFLTKYYQMFYNTEDCNE